jgi:hypothetical protein
MRALLGKLAELVHQRLVLIAPAQSPVPKFFKRVSHDKHHHRQLIRDVQRFRGRVYLNDGAIQQQQLSNEGLHETPEDEKSWHLVIQGQLGQVTACAWYLLHDQPVRFDHLRVRRTPHPKPWQPLVSKAVESEIALARRERLGYAELGGWAVASENRCTTETLGMALTTYSLSQALGGALGITQATVRHASSTILRRLGGDHLTADGVVIPPYFDPKYGCDMELLRFDSRQPGAKYVGLIERLREKLASAPVVAPGVSPSTRGVRSDSAVRLPVVPALPRFHIAAPPVQ